MSSGYNYGDENQCFRCLSAGHILSVNWGPDSFFCLSSLQLVNWSVLKDTNHVKMPFFILYQQMQLLSIGTLFLSDQC